MKYQINWVNDTKNTYLFGTSIRFLGKRVLFKNQLMPSGNAIKTWHSSTQFQAHRILPELPLLQREETYHLTFQGRTVPEKGLYLRVTFYDRFRQEVGFEVLKEGKTDFTYPTDAYAYSIQLINAGCTELVFDSLLLSDQAPGQEKAPQVIQHPTAAKDVLNVVFTDTPKHDLDLIEAEGGLALSDLLLVADEAAVEGFYLNQTYSRKLQQELQGYEAGYGRLRFIGYGPVGNLAALYYNYKFPGSQAYVTDQFLDERVYQRILHENRVQVDKSPDSLLERLVYSRDIVTYGFNAAHNKDLELVSPTISSIRQLDYLPFLEKD